jgi:hypothetical protein
VLAAQAEEEAELWAKRFHKETGIHPLNYKDD